MTLWKYGDTGPDGRVFLQYRKRPSGFIYEQWASPEWFSVRAERNRVRMRDYKRRKAAEKREQKERSLA